jgi:alkyl hydroperoxide reductase subunit F
MNRTSDTAWRNNGVKMVYDCVIIGGGPAGLTSGVYLARYQRKTVLLTDNIGGQTAISGAIENFPTYESINGFELIDKLARQAKASGLEIKTDFKIERISKKDNFVVKSKHGDIEAKSVLIASGKRHRTLGLDNETNLIGKGVSYCATCDGGFAKGKDVVVIGGGYAATESALILEKIAQSVTIICIDKELTGESVTIKNVLSKKNIKVIYNAKTIKLGENKGFLDHISIQNTFSGKTQNIAALMAFIEIGQIPNSEPFKNLKTNKCNEIVVDECNMTSEQGIFAAGDVTDIKSKQTVIACGEGAKAAISINQYLQKNS